MVMTAKHHDGVALFDTGYSDLSVVKKTPAARDLVKEYTAAMREAGLKVGLYYSLIDWSDPRYRTVYPEGMKKEDCLNDIYGSPGWKRGGAAEMAGVSGIQQSSVKRTDVELRNGGSFMV